jgi:chitin synthase
MSTGQPLEYERLIVPRARRKSSGPARATVLKTALTRLDYHGLRKVDVDTGTGSPRLEPQTVPDLLSVCLTAYNEEVSAYHTSLSALARGADYFIGAGEPRLGQEFTICILVDGIDRMSASFAAYAQHLGIYQPALLDPRADYHLFESSIDRHLLQFAPEDLLRDAGTLTNLSPLANRQRIVLLIKRGNRGKLDSHRCFFEIACREVRPAYFLQVDVGTSPDAGAVHEMWRSIAHSSHVAAVSARSHMPQPQGITDLLGSWQYGDIAIERILLWPTEMLMGYMSVLSGQLCLTRSDAVWHKPAEPSAADGRVMQSYLRGLEQLGPFESNMFLAEDRILGLEIVFQPDSCWELGYVPEANAAIDKCETWNELLCQRRRWKCSSVACRLWMFTRVLDYARSANRTLVQKLRILSATTFHAAYFLIEWLMPAFAVLIFSSLHHFGAQSLGESSPWRTLADSSFVGLLMLLATQLAVSASGRITPATNRFYGFSIACQTVYMLAMTTLVVAGNLHVPAIVRPLILLGAMLGAVLVLAHGYAREVFRGLLRCLATYWGSRPAVSFLIMTYAALNSHNTSWGTKGLTRPQYLEGAVQDFRRFRLKTVLLMLGANAGFYALAVRAGWTTSFAGVEVVLWLLLAQIAVAFVGRIAIAWRKFKES